MTIIDLAFAREDHEPNFPLDFTGMEGAKLPVANSAMIARIGATKKEIQSIMKAFRLAAMAALLVVGTATTHADQTNIVENIQFRLFGLQQGDTRTNRNLVVTSVDTTWLGTDDIVQALAEATGNSFSRRGRLVLVTPVDGGTSSVEVRDGDQSVDVTGFFVLEQLGDSVTGSVLNLRSGNSTQTIYSVQHIALQDAPGYSPLNVHFDISGLGNDTANDFRRRGNGLTVFGAGSGDRNGAALVIQGSMIISGQTLEVVTDTDDGDVVS